MVAEVEEFVSDGEAQRRRIEALNTLSNFVYGLKSQLTAIFATRPASTNTTSNMAQYATPRIMRSEFRAIMMHALHHCL